MMLSDMPMVCENDWVCTCMASSAVAAERESHDKQGQDYEEEGWGGCNALKTINRKWRKRKVRK